MSKSITIQEDGVARNLSLDVLRIPKKDGGTEDWVPEDEKNLVNIRVKQNGTYNASDFGAYGIAEVKVACTAAGGSATSSAVSKTLNNRSNPAIKEGDNARTFTAQRLETLLQGGGSCKWVQKDAVGLGTKNINVDNKTYKAEDDGKYGYSEVVVSGISITTSTDDDGNEVVEHTDGTGTETQIVPSSIVLEPKPSFTGPYGDRAYISFDGMVVKAYKGDGSLWSDAKHPNGIIPFEELILPVTVTDISQVHDDGSGEWDVTGVGLNAPVYFDSVLVDKCYIGNGEIDSRYPTEISASSPVYLMQMKDKDHKDHYNQIFVSLMPFVIKTRRVCPSGWSPQWATETGVLLEIGEYSAYCCGGSTSYYAKANVSVSAEQNYTPSETAVLAITGGVPPVPGQDVPVQWERTGDNQLLETSFMVRVVDVSPNNNDGN